MEARKQIRFRGRTFCGDKVDARGVSNRVCRNPFGVSDAMMLCAIALCRRQRQLREENSVADCGTTAIVEFVLASRQELKPMLYTNCLLADSIQVFKGLVIGVNVNGESEQIPASTRYFPDDGTCVQFQRRPVFSVSSEARLRYSRRRICPPTCAYSEVTPSPSWLATQTSRKGREPSLAVFQSGRTRTGGEASSSTCRRQRL